MPLHPTSGSRKHLGHLIRVFCVRVTSKSCLQVSHDNFKHGSKTVSPKTEIYKEANAERSLEYP